MIPLLAAMALVSMSSCGGEEKVENPTTLFPSCNLSEVENTSELSNLISGSRIINLETSDSCLIGGRDGKILKRNSIFYIRSINDVILFGNDGKYLRKLSKVGSGNGEYANMRDFDVACRPEADEIWVASNKEIDRYDSGTLDFLGKIKSDNYINQICYVNDSTILTVTPGDQSIRVITIDGQVRKTELDKDEANLDAQPVQFRKVGDYIVYKISSTNEALAYSPSQDEFFRTEIIPASEKILTTAANREYCDKYGYLDQPSKIAKDFIRISSFQTDGDSYVMTTFHPGSSPVFTYGAKDKASQSWEISSDNLKIGDITLSRMMPLLTIIACDSDNGFLCELSSSFIEGRNPEDNPSLLEIKFGPEK